MLHYVLVHNINKILIILTLLSFLHTLQEYKFINFYPRVSQRANFGMVCKFNISEAYYIEKPGSFNAPETFSGGESGFGHFRDGFFSSGT